MRDRDSHLSDQQILLFLEGELSKRRARLAGEHLEACWRCRARRQELEQGIADFTQIHLDGAGPKLPSADGRRALLRAQLAQLGSAAPDQTWLPFRFSPERFWAAAASLCGLLAAGWLLVHIAVRWDTPASHPMVSIPNSSLTP